ncbi:Translation machinery-associated protein 22 [Linum perenne]
MLLGQTKKKIVEQKNRVRIGEIELFQKGEEIVALAIYSPNSERAVSFLNSMAEKPQPVTVLYCGVCSLPPEYCEFGPDFEKCKPWLVKNAPDVYPDLLKDADGKDADKVSERLQSIGISDGSADGAASSAQSAGQTSAAKPEEVKRLPGGKVKKKLSLVDDALLTISFKYAWPMSYGFLISFSSLKEPTRRIKLSDASKRLGKKFATGASVVKGPTEKEQIDVQGDIAYDIVEFITDTWPDVPERAIYFIEDGKKVPAA